MDAWIWIVIAVVVVIIAALVIMALASRRRRAHLQDQFGPEYDRTVDGAGKRRAAERDLRDREAQHEELDLRPLTPAARDRYQHDWQELQTRFVDRPQVAVAEADSLLTNVMRERGYPVDDFESKSALVSVDHPRVVENYRTAHSISQRAVDGQADTEDLRVAVVSYRALFEELVDDGTDHGDGHEVDARQH